MEVWELRSIHYRDVNDAMNNNWKRYNGNTFWNIMRKRGHSSACFEECVCYKERGKHGKE